MSDLVVGEDGLARPPWASTDPLLRAYYDTEWGMPVRDERGLFERLSLEGFQSGLSWATILRRREGFRRAFAGFDPEAVAEFTEGDVERLLQDTGIIRHRGKIEAAINNAKRAKEMVKREGSLAAFLWRYALPAGSPSSTAATTNDPTITYEKPQRSRRSSSRSVSSAGEPMSANGDSAISSTVKPTAWAIRSIAPARSSATRTMNARTFISMSAMRSPAAEASRASARYRSRT